MASDRQIWTGDIRRVLYKQLVREFGPLDTWEKVTSPGRGRDKAFETFCDQFRKVVGATSAKAVQHQIRFAMPETSKGSTWGRQAQTAILNKAAALEAGFIKDKHLPNIHAVGRS